MRTPRAKAHLFELLQSSGDPRIASVEKCITAGQPNIRVTGTDGISIELMLVNSSPPGGDAHSTPERIVTRDGREPRPIIGGHEEWRA